MILNPQFQPFDAESVSTSSTLKSILGQPILHIFWTECSDIDTYKNSTKDEVQNWLTILKKCGVPHDWMVVLVEAPERKMSNKLLPRTSVLDKLKTDVGTKNAERCYSLLDPTRTHDPKAGESWQTLLHRLRLLLLQAYNRTLTRFEENMRSQREKRNDPKWNFCDYFLLQEELAFVYESLGVFDEALVQYDELDALFTGVVLNCNVAESPKWLEDFCGEFSDWSGLSLTPEDNARLRLCIMQKTPSLLDVRNYMFARQSQMLLNMSQPFEVARRCLAFLHNGVQELTILDVSCPKGSIACWILLSALEVLKTCQDMSQSSSSQVQQFCLYTAELWSYCREKLYQLGELCGLLPKCEPSSDQLHFVVELSSGIRDKTGPVERLKEALCSKSAFQKYYLELSESAISTYKHIGRIRSARMVGLELAKFYCELGQVQKALNFLVDGLKTFEMESWSLLKVQTLIETARCYEQLQDSERLARTAAQLACAPCLLDHNEKLEFCSRMFNSVKALQNVPTFINAEDLLEVKIIKLATPEKVTPGSKLDLELEITSRFPTDVPIDEILVSLTFVEPMLLSPSTDEADKKSLTSKPKRTTVRHLKTSSVVQRSPSTKSTSSTVSSLMSLETTVIDEEIDTNESTLDDSCVQDENRLEMSETFDYKQDKSLASVRLVCKNSARVLKRKDSSGTFLQEGSIKKTDFTHCFQITPEDKVLKPGSNNFTLTTTCHDIGQYTLNQLCVKALDKKMELLSDQWMTLRKTKFNVITESHSFSTSIPSQSPFLAGFAQDVVLNIFTGSHSLNEDTKIRLKCSHGLFIANAQGTPQESVLVIDGLKAKPFESISATLKVKADLPLSKDGAFIEHRFMIEDPWEKGQETVLPLLFRPPFTTVAKIQTASTRKFVQVSFQANCEDEAVFALKNATIEGVDKDLEFKAINPAHEVLVLKRHSISSLIWELLTKDVPNELKLKIKVFYGKSVGEQNTEFSVQEKEPFVAAFDFKDFKTQYLLKCKIDPSKGELCRASSICALSIMVEQLNDSTYKSLMYEVLADQGMWAVCGQSSGVIDMDMAKKQTLVVEVMPLTGGHLALPKVRLSKYIPPSTGQSSEGSHEVGKVPASGSMPRLEPFAPGQVYNQTRTARVHVLPAPNAHNSSSLGSNFGSNPRLHDSKFNSMSLQLP